MNTEKNDKKQILIGMGIGILIMVLLVFGTTYAYFIFNNNNEFGTQSINVSTEGTDTQVALTKVGDALTLDLKAVDMLQDRVGTAYYASGSSTPATIGKINVGSEGVSYYCTFTMTISKSSTTEEKDLYTKFQNMSTKSEGQIYLSVNNEVYDFNTENLFPITYNGMIDDITKENAADITANLAIVNTNVDQTELKDADISLQFEVTEFNCEVDTMEGSLNGTELVANPNEGLNTTMEGGLYRYQGTNEEVNNHVCFGTIGMATCVGDTDAYMYRIMGVTSDGKLKLIKKEALNEGIEWYSDHEVNRTWPSSTIYSSINGSTFLTNTTYVPSGWSNKIATTPWKYGDNQDINVTAANLYNTENAWITTTNAKIGLMYVHDYAYGLSEGNNCSASGAYEICVTSWLHLSNNDSGSPSAYEWTMTRYGLSNSTYRAWSGNSLGSVLTNGLSGTYYVRPVFYLTPDVKIVSGSGTSSDPFILSGNYILS